MKKQLRGLFFIAAILLIPVAAWTLDLSPRIEKQKQLKTEISEQRQKLQNVKTLRKKIENLNKEIEDIEKVIEHFGQKLPSETEIETVLKEVWKIAKANELQTRKISTRKVHNHKRFTSPQSPYGEQVVIMNISGDFRGFYSFLTTMEKLPRLMKVRKMLVTEHKKLPTGHVVGVIELSLFYEPSSRG